MTKVFFLSNKTVREGERDRKRERERGERKREFTKGDTQKQGDILERGLQPKGIGVRHKGLCSYHSRDLSNYGSSLAPQVYDVGGVSLILMKYS